MINAYLKSGRQHADATARRATVSAVLLLATAGIPMVAPNLMSDYGFEIGFRLLVLLTLAEAWNLQAGYGGLVSLGTASFVGVGGYLLVGVLNYAGMSIFAALTIAALGAAALAALVSPAVFRLKGLYFTVGTLALGEALRMFMVNASWFGGATGWFSVVDPPNIQVLYSWAWVLLALATVVVSLYVSSRLSIALKAVRDDEAAATQIGVRAFRVKLVAFMIASALMGATGALQALKLGAIEPYGMFGIAWSVNVLSIVIIGGFGLRFGPLAGTIFIVAMAEWLADYPDVHIALTGVMLIVVIRYAPQGLVGLMTSLAKKRSTTNSTRPAASGSMIHPKGDA